MTNFKKIGLTALAGSLAVTSLAQAGSMEVTGTAQMEYESNAYGTGMNTVTDEFRFNQNLSFSGSGELDNGFGVSLTITENLNGAGTVTSATVALDMGDYGVLRMDDYYYGAGMAAYQDVVPNAGEQVWDDTGASDHGSPDEGITNPSTSGIETLGYTVNRNGFILSTSLAFEGTGSEESAVIAADGVIEGLLIGAGLGNNSIETGEDDMETYFVRYSMGPVTLGAQQSEVNAMAANSDIDRNAYGVSFAVNENLSISYGISDTDFEASAQDEENQGISASYTAGGATVGFVHNRKDNAVGTANADHETTELKLTFAF